VDLLSAVPTEQVISFDRVACSQEHGYNNGIGYTSGSEDLPAITKPLTTTSNYWIDDHLGTPWSPISTNAAITTMINDSLQSESLSLDSHLGAGSPSWSSCPSWEFSQVHLEILNRFQTRTALTIGGEYVMGWVTMHKPWLTLHHRLSNGTSIQRHRMPTCS
jgi:hypothetical protein